MLRMRGAYQAAWRAMPLSHSGRPVVGVASRATDARRTLSTSSPIATEASATAQPYLLEPLVPYLSSLPDFLHLPEGSHKYALSIFLGTWLLRTAFTLPVTIWQRRRTRRMVEQVGPRWERIKAELPPKIRARSRRMGHPYELFQKELQAELRKELRALTQRYKCTPLPTFIVPLAVNVPLFISVSLLLRTALILHDPAGLSSEAIPWWRPPAELQERFDASAKLLAARGIEGEALAQLTKMHGPTLQDVDRTMLGPIGLGIATMANVELGQWLRRGLRGPKEGEGHKKTGKKTDDGKEIVEVDLGVLRESFMGNTLRVMSIVFVAISSQAPAGLVVYWLSSASYTLMQNTLLAIYDKATAKTPT